MARDRLVVTVVTATLALVAFTERLEPASLAAVRDRGIFAVCAHPDALPYSSENRAMPGFQLEIAAAIAKQLGVRLDTRWIVFTRHARRTDCDGTIGSIVKADDEGRGGGGPRLTKPYVSSGYVLVVPVHSKPITQLTDVKTGKIGVEHTSWPHYVLDSRKIPLASYGSPTDVLEAVAKGEVAAALVSDAYAGWYIKLQPGVVKVSDTYTPEPEFRWNVSVGLRNADAALVDAVNRALDTLIADGTIPGIFARYGIAYRPPVTR